mgnify:CR=1 FL=1
MVNSEFVADTLFEVEVRDRSYRYLFKRFKHHDKYWLGMSRFKKWYQDGLFHPDTGLMFPDGLFETEILPALHELYGIKLPKLPCK